MTEITITRRGSVTIFYQMVKDGKGGFKKQFKSVRVREYSDGSMSFHSDGPTYTTDGYVKLQEEYHDKVQWDK